MAKKQKSDAGTVDPNAPGAGAPPLEANKEVQEPITGDELLQKNLNEAREGKELTPPPGQEEEKPAEGQEEDGAEDDTKVEDASAGDGKADAARQEALSMARLKAEQYRQDTIKKAEQEIQNRIKNAQEEKLPTEEELKELAEKDPVAALKILSKIEAKKLLEDSKSREEIARRELSDATRLADSNKKVYETHPEIYMLDHGTPEEKAKAMQTPFAQAYLAVLQEKPHLQEYPDGAEIVSMMAEEKLGIRGQSGGKTPQQQQFESMRNGRAAGAAALGGGSPSNPPPPAGQGNAVLDANQREIAEKLGLSEDEYRRGMPRKSPFDAAYYQRIRKQHASNWKKKVS